MTTQTSYRLDLLTNDSVSIVKTTYIIDDNGIKTKLGNVTRRAFTNSAQQRNEIQNNYPEHCYNTIIDMWGETPTVADLAMPTIS